VVKRSSFVKLHVRAISVGVLASILLAATGCGVQQKDRADVSGVVTLDGRPLAGGTIRFQPIAPAGSTIAGKGSYATLDSAGKYQLQTIDQKPGAVIGNHRVMIYGPQGQANSASDDGPATRDIVPRKFNAETTLSYTVPAEGATDADFTLSTK
jgi:hypothetical protein